MSFSDIDTGAVFNTLFTEAKQTAGAAWDEIRSFVKIEFKGLARQIKEIGKALERGEIKLRTARTLFKMARNNLIAAVATTTTLVLAAAQRIINAALTAIKDLVNGALGLVLI